MSNKESGGPAFPIVGRLEEVQTIGATLRDYFAAHAPSEIPSWFDEYKEIKAPSKPTPPPHATPEQRRTAAFWIGDPCYDLEGDPILEQFQRDYAAWVKKVHEVSRLNKSARYIAWRWYFADQMLSARQP